VRQLAAALKRAELAPGQLATVLAQRPVIVNCCHRHPEFTAQASWREATWNEKAVASYRTPKRTSCVQRSDSWLDQTNGMGSCLEFHGTLNFTGSK